MAAVSESTPYTAQKGRRFGLTVGAAFLVLAAVTWWRDHPTLMTVFGTLGGVLSLAGLAIPAQLGPVERAWMGLALAISKVTTPIIMGIMYLGVLFPVGLLRRSLGGNPMQHAPMNGSYWHHRPESARRSTLGRQY